MLVEAYRNSNDGLPITMNDSQVMRLAIPNHTNADGQADTSNTIVIASAPSAAAASSQADAGEAAVPTP